MGDWKDHASSTGWGQADSFCMYLGASNDPETHFAYPSAGNCCHRVHPPAEVNLAYQEEFCLTAKFSDCPVYQQTVDALPARARSKRTAHPSMRWSSVWLYLLLLSLVLSLSFAGLWYGGFLQIDPPAQMGSTGQASVTPMVGVSQSTPSQTSPPATQTPSKTATYTPTQTETITPSPSATIQPSVTNTLPPTPGPGLGTPFGTENMYVIHRVQEGQTFGILANLYNTTEEVIRAANVLREGKSLWPGDYLVIPVGEKDPTQVIAFTWYYTERRVTLDELAAQFSVTVEEIIRYNSLGAYDWIPVGRWLIVPAVE